jgi:large subunit ribosomal protein L15
MAMKLGSIKPAEGAVKRRRRVGVGTASGHGKTCGRGSKGQKAHGKGPRHGFEGGQMPLSRRVPKRGFKNIFAKEYEVVNVKDLESFGADTEVGPDVLRENGLIRKGKLPVKILGDGELKKALVVRAHGFSSSAVKKIEEAGGKAIEIVGDGHARPETKVRGI